MAKTYTAAGTVVAGDVATAAAFNVVTADINNLIVPPACRLTRSNITQNFPNNTFTAVTFDSEAFDTDAMHSTVSNTSRITISTDGVYSLSGNLVSPSATVHQLLAAFYKNGAEVFRSGDFGGSGTLQMNSISVATILEAIAGDYFEFFAYAYVSPASSRTFTHANFAAAWIGRTS